MTDLNRMRQAFAVASTWHGWSKADQAEIGAEITAAIESGDEERLALWSAYLEEVSDLLHLAQACRAAEQRIRHAAAEKRRPSA